MASTFYSIANAFIRFYYLILRAIFTVLERPLKYKMVKDLERAGITVNGTKPSDPKVTNGKVFSQVGYKGTIGLGEAYVDGWWDCERLDDFWTKIFKGGMAKKIMHPGERFVRYLKFNFFGSQAKKQTVEGDTKPYEVGMFTGFLIL